MSPVNKSPGNCRQCGKPLKPKQNGGQPATWLCIACFRPSPLQATPSLGHAWRGNGRHDGGKDVPTPCPSGLKHRLTTTSGFIPMGGLDVPCDRGFGCTYVKHYAHPEEVEAGGKQRESAKRGAFAGGEALSKLRSSE